MIVVSNTTPLIAFASLNRFDLLHGLFEEITVPQAVYSEALKTGHKSSSPREELQTATWIKRATVRDQLAVNLLLDELDHGEAEAIVLAHELKANWVLMDEKKGRRKLCPVAHSARGNGWLITMGKTRRSASRTTTRIRVSVPERV